MVIEKEDVVAVWMGDKPCCTSCVSERDVMIAEKVLTVGEFRERTRAGDKFFCCVCDRRIRVGDFVKR